MRKPKIVQDPSKCQFIYNRKGKIKGRCLKCSDIRNTCGIYGINNGWTGKHRFITTQEQYSRGTLYIYKCICGYELSESQGYGTPQAFADAFNFKITACKYSEEDNSIMEIIK